MTDVVASRRRRRRGVNPLEYLKRPWMWLTLLACFLFLYFPLVTLVAFSFNSYKRGFIWKGFSLKWYEKALNNQSLHEAFFNSMHVAAVSTVVSTALGAMLGLALYRYWFPWKGTYEGIAHLPIVIPEICMAVAMVTFFWAIGIELSLSTVIVSHIAFTIPFVAVVVRARMAGFDKSLEEASRDLGASEWQTFWYVTFPYMIPGLVAGALMAFVLSLDDFVITFFTAGVGDNTFPVKIYSMLRFSVTPEVNAASTILIVITLSLTLVAMIMQSRWTKGHKE
ncbi:MAG: ABC transporter permease [Alphaproteobacteria bacterium]|nr:ABC transporter permease [Alphaproteobacteria bacterium]